MEEKDRFEEAKKSKLLARLEQLGVDHGVLKLQRAPGRGKWFGPRSRRRLGVEAAVLEEYKANGWDGTACEGAIFKHLLPAMAFEIIPYTHAGSGIVPIFMDTVHRPSTAVPREQLLRNIRKATSSQIKRNHRRMSLGRQVATGYGTSSIPRLTKEYPELTWRRFVALYEALGNRQLHAIACQIAKDPVGLNCGWPDLTVWRDGSVNLIEVKAPGDQLSATQDHFIRNVIWPTNLPCLVVSVQLLN